MRKLAREANKRLDSCNDQDKRWLEQIVDIFFTKIYKESPKKVKSRPKYILPLFFENKGLQFLRLSNILHDEDVKSKLPRKDTYSCGRYYICQVFLEPFTGCCKEKACLW